jgi:hypothetical protein
MTISARTFCFGLIGAVVAIVAAIVAANVVIDPEEMFQTNLLPVHSSPNTRYQKFHAYQRDAQGVDGLFFASSRGGVFDLQSIATSSGAQRVASFSVIAGAITDHVEFLEFILRDKAARGEHIKQVLLLLDTDLFGTSSWTNRNLDSFMPPEVSGESSFRFWMRYLVSFQMTNWRESIRQSREGAPGLPVALDRPDRRIRLAANGAIRGPLVSDDRERRKDQIPGLRLVSGETPSAPSTASDLSSRIRRERISSKPFLDEQLRQLARFVALCRQNDIRLTVAINPLNRVNQQQYVPGHLQEMVARISAVTDVWDFEAPAWLESDPAHWFEISHFKPEIAELMLRRMYANGAGVPEGFGRLLKQGGR